MARLTIPNDLSYLAAFGKVAIAHSHLELVQRFLVRTLANIDMVVALDSTESFRAADVRKRVRKLAKERRVPERVLCRLDALLERATTLSKERNVLLHRTVQDDPEGRLVQKGEDQRWGPAPTDQELKQLAEKIQKLADEMNEERLKGFIRDACRDHPLTNASGS